MAYGFSQKLSFGKPVSGAAMQFGLRSAVTSRQTRGEKISEQRMKAIPGLPVVCLHTKNQQIVFIEALQHCLCRVTAGYCLGE
ncbi:hypothetical protein D3C77_409810 [compost metagenome]